MANRLALVSFLALSSLIGGQEVEYDNDAWTKAAQYLRSAMEPTADVCNDFYERVCGRFNSSGPVNDTQTYQRAQVDKAANSMKILEAALNSIDPSNPKTPKYQRDILAFYDRCSAQEQDPKKLLKQKYDAIAARIGPLKLFNDDGPPSDLDFWRLAGILGRQAEIAIGVRAAVVKPTEVRDEITAFANVTTVVPVLVISPGVSFFLTTQKKITAIFKSTADALGRRVDESRIQELVERIFVLFDQVLGVMGDVKDPTAGSFYSYANATARYPYLERCLKAYLTDTLWDDWTSNTDTATIWLQGENELEKLDAIASNATNAEAWQALAYVGVLQSFDDRYWGLDTKSRNKRCLNVVTKSMSAGAARLYFDHIGEDIARWRSEIQLMARNVFAAFRFMLNSIDWLDDEDKVKINEKIDAIKYIPGIPEWIMDDEKLDANTYVYSPSQSLNENDLQHITNTTDRQSRRLVNWEEKEEEPAPTFEINSRYDPSTNTVYTYLGFILPPYYQPTYPLAVKYGGLGMVIGHELVHAFDSVFVYKSPAPNRPWLKPITLEAFENRTSCLVDQYSQYCYKKLNVCINGEQTIQDNIADIDGLKAAYLAYKYVSMSIGGDIPVPQLYEYTSDQIFFISATRQWCTRNDPRADDLRYDQHSPDRARIEMAVRNMPQFAAAFDCPSNSTAVPKRRCPLWGDFNVRSQKPTGKQQKKTKKKTPTDSKTDYE